MKEELPTVAGRRIATSNNDFERACLVQLMHYQERHDAESAMVHVLCEAVRMVREYSDNMNESPDSIRAELTKLKADVERLRRACDFAARTFREYEQLHLRKGTADGIDKAAVNGNCAKLIESALEETK